MNPNPISGPILKTLAEAWDRHITSQMDGAPMDSDEYHIRYLDYLAGSVDVLAVLMTQVQHRTGQGTLTLPIFADTFMQLFQDTQLQLDNQIAHMGGPNAQPDYAMDDKPKQV
jgi:hypothetical protein